MDYFKHEPCESRAANLLQSLDNLPEHDLEAKINALEDVCAELLREIEELQRRLDKK